MKLKNNKAITLIALVITIVVLIILATVAINLTIGNNGIFQRAKTAKEQYQISTNEEQVALSNYSNIIDNSRSIDKNELRKMVREIIDEENIDMTRKYKAGVATMPSGSSNNTVSVNVTFAVPFENNNYSVVVTGAADVAYWAQCQYGIYNKTANGFQIAKWQWDGTKAAHNVYWMAVANNDN